MKIESNESNEIPTKPYSMKQANIHQIRSTNPKTKQFKCLNERRHSTRPVARRTRELLARLCTKLNPESDERDSKKAQKKKNNSLANNSIKSNSMKRESVLEKVTLIEQEPQQPLKNNDDRGKDNITTNLSCQNNDNDHTLSRNQKNVEKIDSNFHNKEYRKNTGTSIKSNQIKSINNKSNFCICDEYSSK
jgi:hypothetical protein